MTWEVGWWLVAAVAAAVPLYANVVYPVTVRLFSSARSVPAEPPTDELPEVTLIIPAHNEAEVLSEKLENVIALDYPADRLRVIVAADGCTDRTVALAEAAAAGSAAAQGPAIRTLNLSSRGGKARAVTIAAAECDTPLLCLCDANVLFRPDALRRMVRHFADPGVGAVTGEVRLASERTSFGAGESLYYRLERWLAAGDSDFGSCVCVDGGMYVIRRNLFQPMPPDTILDDLTQSVAVMNAERRIVYEPAAIAAEDETPTAVAEFARRRRLAAGAAQAIARGVFPGGAGVRVAWQFISHKWCRWVGPLALIALLAAGVALWGTGPAGNALLAAQVAVYAVAGVAAGWPAARRSRIVATIFYVVLSHVAMVVGTLDAVVGRRGGVWQRTPRPQRSSHATAVADSGGGCQGT